MHACTYFTLVGRVRDVMSAFDESVIIFCISGYFFLHCNVDFFLPSSGRRHRQSSVIIHHEFNDCLSSDQNEGTGLRDAILDKADLILTLGLLQLGFTIRPQHRTIVRRFFAARRKQQCYRPCQSHSDSEKEDDQQRFLLQ